MTAVPMAAASLPWSVIVERVLDFRRRGGSPSRLGRGSIPLERVAVASARAGPRRQLCGEPQLPAGFDFTDPDLYAHRVPAEEFAELRRAAPVWWNAQQRGAGGFDDDGYWVVTRHADVVEVSRNSDLFGSWENTAIIRLGEVQTEDSLDDAAADPAQHRPAAAHQAAQHRLARLHAAGDRQPARRAHRAGRADRRAARCREGTGDFVADVACELPLQAIAELIGVPQEDRKKIFDWSNTMIGYDDPEFGEDGQAAAAELVGYAMLMAEDRRQCPRDDIVTKLVNARDRRRRAVLRRVRVLRDPAVGGGQRDDPERDLARHARVLRPPRPVGAVQRRAAARPRRTRSSAGPRR